MRKQVNLPARSQNFGELIRKWKVFLLGVKHKAAIRDTLQEIPNSAASFGKNKLDKPGIDNEKTRAEIKKLNAEAGELELNTEIKNFQFWLMKVKISETVATHLDDEQFIQWMDELQRLLNR
jgi:hypothetical protein